jgi:hypothetical protein
MILFLICESKNVWIQYYCMFNFIVPLLCVVVISIFLFIKNKKNIGLCSVILCTYRIFSRASYPCYVALLFNFF